LSSKMYESKSACENEIESIKKTAGDAEHYEKRDPYFVLKAKNGQEISRREIYQGGSGDKKAINSVMTNPPEAEAVETTSA
jgi:uncharacterized protein